ncbi:MAG: hypothetical protein AB1558_03360, partial [Thermodesulfobacteriota bacterium]
MLIPVVLSALILCGEAWSSSPWLSLPSDARNVVRKAAADELGKRKAYSTPQEDTALWNQIEDEKSQGDDLYREHVERARMSFVRARQTRDDLLAQDRWLSADLDDALKRIKTIRATIESIDHSLVRWDREIRNLRKSFEAALSAVRGGPVLVAAVYTADAKATQRALDLLADRASAPVLEERRAADRASFAKALEGILSEGFGHGIPAGAYSGDREGALSAVLAKDDRGVTHLRLKRYDFFPFQQPAGEPLRTQVDTGGLPAAVIGSIEELAGFLKKRNHSLGAKETKQAEFLVRDTAQGRTESERYWDGQIRSFREKNAGLQKNIADGRYEFEMWAAALKKLESRSEPLRQSLDRTRTHLEAAERSFKEARNSLLQRMGLQETIVPIKEAVFLKGSQRPAEAAADAVADKIADAKKDAEAQYV